MVNCVRQRGGKFFQRFDLGERLTANQLRVQIGFARKAIVRRAEGCVDFFGTVAKEIGEACGNIFAGILGEGADQFGDKPFADDALGLTL